MRDKHTHTHVKTGELSPDLLLGGHVAIRQPVVLKQSKAFVVHETELVDQIVARMVTKHPEVRGVVETEPGGKEHVARR